MRLPSDPALAPAPDLGTLLPGEMPAPPRLPGPLDRGTRATTASTPWAGSFLTLEVAHNLTLSDKICPLGGRMEQLFRTKPLEAQGSVRATSVLNHAQSPPIPLLKRKHLRRKKKNALASTGL